MSGYQSASVIGAGAWGTALAQVCARAGLSTRIWAREAEVARSISERRENPLFLPGVALDPRIAATDDIAAAAGADILLLVTPAQHARTAIRSLAPRLPAGRPVLLCAKGVEQGTLSLMTEVLAAEAPAAAPAVLSGPSFAGEVARGLPTAVTLACADPALGEALARAIATPTFRPYWSSDLIGAEAGGAVKNVLAIACGIAEGRGLGRSAHAALVTRGFAEMTRLAVALGAQRDTLSGLCGLGDLVLTCSSPQSRNMSLGMALGRGERLEDALSGRLSVAEGVASAPAVTALARRVGAETPICDAVARVLAGETGPTEAIEQLLSRPLKGEQEDLRP